VATDEDERFMRAALEEARKGLGHTSPNPAVGAVLVIGGEIVARGHHVAAGLPHAEIECLRSWDSPVPADATLYVTLEPCSSTGRTPPCTTALIQAGVRHVVVGAIDPNPRHTGRGLDQLISAGIHVRSGVLGAECAAINEAFNKWIQTKQPFVIAKCGMSLDGRLTRPSGEPRWLTSTTSRRHANAMRAQVDAILVGAETVRTDNPRLTVRNMPGAKQPWRVVLTRSGKLPRDAHLFTDRFADRTLVFQNRSLADVLSELGQKDITNVLIEGGGEILAEALDARLIDRIQIYVAPLLTGGVIAFGGRGAASAAEGLRLRELRYEKVDRDIFLTGKATYGVTISE
jgi:diaminohydroxyphosphoribosylaminopyrimidine deaminase / 5-amino-6-(5-phosphoribosylamino)uracil reductase